MVVKVAAGGALPRQIRQVQLIRAEQIVREENHMLVLSRKAGEDVLIGDEVAVSVVAIQGNRVKLAFTAPDEVVIRRAELVGAMGKWRCDVEETEAARSEPK